MTTQKEKEARTALLQGFPITGDYYCMSVDDTRERKGALSERERERELRKIEASFSSQRKYTQATDGKRNFRISLKMAVFNFYKEGGGSVVTTRGSQGRGRL
jgi:hypothetical protein